MARAFNRAQRIALFHFAQGKCKECGAELGKNFHADHVIPWSKKGATDVTNGRALCATCNLTKGNKTMISATLRKIYITLRSWQVRGGEHVRKLFVMNQPTALIAATMGTGKTICGAAIARELLGNGSIQRVIVVTTSKNLLKSWVKAADLCGFDLFKTFDATKGIPSDCHGVVITYARLCTYYAEKMTSFAEYLRAVVTEVPTLVILDEPHHLSGEDDASWGLSAEYAFEFARYRLLMTGTPWRTDRTEIPFVTYDPDSETVITDFRYSYKEALLDDPCVVRRVNFPLVDSAVTFERNKQVRTYDMLELVPKSQEADAVKTALNSEISTWLPNAIKSAHQELLQMRDTDPQAGALLVVSDTKKMPDIVKMVRKETGCDPVVVHSNLPTDIDVEARIDAFRDSDAPWMIAVQMISEGVDIPRLRVGVYGTNIRTRLAFRQFVGRFLRVVDDRDYDYASVYVIRTGDMITHVREFEDEVDEALKKNADECICGCGCKNGANCGCGCKMEWCNCGKTTGGEKSEFNPISGTGDLRETYQSGESYSYEEMEEAKQLRSQFSKYKTWSLSEIAQVARYHRGKSNGESGNGNGHQAKPEKSKEDRRHEARKIYDRLVKKKVVKARLPERATQEDFQRVHLRVSQIVGAAADLRTEEQWKQAITLVSEQFEDLWI